MNIIPGKCTLLGCNRINKARLWASEYDSSKPIKSQRKIRCIKAKQKDDKNEQKQGETSKTHWNFIHMKLFIMYYYM